MTVVAGPARHPNRRASEKKRGPLVRPAQPGRLPFAGCCSQPASQAGLRRGIVERCIEEGSRTVPGGLGQRAPFLQADRTEEPCGNEIESLLKVSAGPARRPIPQVRTLDGTVASFIRGVKQACLTCQNGDC
eukprot:3249285-Amphidinium_carterae.1